jgi:cytochrome c-type biogenesis protein CcmH/NrfG
VSERDAAEDRAQLEAERDFLLKSLDDLEVERAAGNIDDESYRALHEDYTARAAGSIRALRDGVDARPSAPPVAWGRRALMIGGAVGFVVLAAFGLAAALGARLPGESSSGNTGPQTSPRQPPEEDRRAELEQAIADNPADVASRLLLAPILEADGDLLGALQRYDEVIAIDPENARAHAHAGRILYLTAGQASEAEATALVDRSRAELDRAVALDAELPDARLFRAIVLANEYGDFLGAQRDAQRYLLLAPNGAYAMQARQLLADVTVALERSSSTSSPR